MQVLGAAALEHERDERARLLSIQTAQHVIDIEKVERTRDREWESINSALQKQLGVEQTSVARTELQWKRAQRNFSVREGMLGRQSAKEHAERVIEQDEYKVSAD